MDAAEIIAPNPVPNSTPDIKNNNIPNLMDNTVAQTNTKIPTSKSESAKKSSSLEIYYDNVIGKGSFAKVYVAKYNEKLVAVKIVDIKKAKPKHIQQFDRELDIIRILRNNPHPSIPEYYKTIRTNERIIIVMEWCRGGELGSYIKKNMSLEQIKYYFYFHEGRK